MINYERTSLKRATRFCYRHVKRAAALFFQAVLWDHKEVSLDSSNLPPLDSSVDCQFFKASSEPQ